MKHEEIKKEIIKIIKEVSSEENLEINGETPLIGENRILDSITLVEVCLKLEDLSLKYSFSFDWTSDEIFSATKSMFRNVESLSNEFLKQKNMAGKK